MTRPVDQPGPPQLDYEATDYTGLQVEISDVFTGETGDLIREHAKAVLALRELNAAVTDVNSAVMAAIGAQSREGWKAFDAKTDVTAIRLAAFHKTLGEQGYIVARVQDVT